MVLAKTLQVRIPFELSLDLKSAGSALILLNFLWAMVLT